ncbi:MAG: hypothetical protein GDA40_06810 [Rhodobacteraceae bacterium]|nr:hypothetical protein [Paracoccaceae bacterium]
MLFFRACVETAPTFKDAKKVISTEPFRQNSTSGTYCHDVYNLSVKVVPGRCSLLFVTSEPTDEVIERSAKGAISAMRKDDIPRDIHITSHAGPYGLTYFRIGLDQLHATQPASPASIN